MTSPFDVLFLEPVEKKKPHVVKVGFVEESGRYKIGKPTRPAYTHDHGFLQNTPNHKPIREPTLDDRKMYTKWLANLNGAELLCNPTLGKKIDRCSGDLTDATAAYRHFLFGKGADRTVNYEGFIRTDMAAYALLDKIATDFIEQIEVIGKDRLKFSVTSSMYSVGTDGIIGMPQTANWQKTLGAHVLWVSADVAVATNSDAEICYNADLTLHIEDRYNFNPGSADIATKISDKENGQLELCGMGVEYMNYAVIRRNLTWVAKKPATKMLTGTPTSQ
ncbi:hypothetical protein HSX11_09000 [Oxalobacteraceae bacterium]|nr:hypothetical protein [Oxalobacteraceae bacterium]